MALGRKPIRGAHMGSELGTCSMGISIRADWLELTDDHLDSLYRQFEYIYVDRVIYWGCYG